jgi:pyridoxine 5-phosphate synthase
MSRSPLLLGVNIDHVATLRQARYRSQARSAGGVVEPDPVLAALLSEQAGANGITVHLREDRRHIQEEDVRRLRASVRTKLNLEMACTSAMVAFALDLSPECACLVPESREEVTTEGGLDVVAHRERVRATVEPLRAAGIEVSLFIDPDAPQIDAAVALGASVVELHTGAFANATGAARAAEFSRLREGALRAHAAGLVVNAGHGINYQNILEVRQLPHLHELNIGHSIVARAVFTGLGEAVREMLRLMNDGGA